MKQLIYYSTAISDMSDEALERILEVSVSNNAQLDITGLLIIKERTFMQTLEGEDAVVDELYHKIEQDPRHKNIILFLQKPITQRQFPNWSMGFKNLNHIPWKSEKLINFSHPDRQPVQWEEHPEIVYTLFQTFLQVG